MIAHGHAIEHGGQLFDALPVVDTDVPGLYRNRQTSQELQILYNRGPVNVLLGAYYLDASAVTIFDVRLPGGLTALTFGDVGTELVLKGIAAAAAAFESDKGRDGLAF